MMAAVKRTVTHMRKTPERPRPAAMDAGDASEKPRIRECFDFGWRFSLGNAEGAQKEDYDDSAWRELDLPHDWGIEGPFDKENPTGGSGGYLPAGIGWYRKRFVIPEGWRGKRVVVEFDGVYMDCDVWVNGGHVGSHRYGYTSFSHELTALLVDGNHPNVVAVRVDNSRQPDSRWYTGSGIYRHTWLTRTEKIHAAQWGVQISTPSVTRKLAEVHVRTRVANDRDHAVTLAVHSTVKDGDAVAAETRSTSTIPPGQEAAHEQEMRVDGLRLWSPDSPSLYTLHTRILVGDEIKDEIETPFGIRKIAFDPDHGFLLNGRRVKINGVCLHHDGGCVGAAVPQRVVERRLEALKRMGCNGIRMSHNPPAPEMLDLCDRMGFLVMDEAFDEWRISKEKSGDDRFGYHVYYDECALDDLRSMLRRDRNHPSIVVWSVGNEIPEQVQPHGADMLRTLVDVCHAEDPSRPVTSACDLIKAEPAETTLAFLEALEVVGYNYVNRWRARTETFYSDDHHAHPDRCMLGSENISVGGARGDYLRVNPTGGPWWRPYNTRMIPAEGLWKFTHAYEYVAGDFMWTGVDYLGESKWPNKNSSSGILDTCGFPKDGYYFYMSRWTEDPMLHIFPHWNWGGSEGSVIPVLCYTNCQSVELFLNGKSYGVKSFEFPRQGMTRHFPYYERPLINVTTSDLHLSWDVPYEPGELRAVGSRNGETVCERRIMTTGVPLSIELLADRESMRADSRDVCHVTVRVLDGQGNLVPTADNLIHFGVEGQGTLIGVDNGRPDSHESFKAGFREVFNGLCLAILQSTFQPGAVTLEARSPGLASGVVRIRTL
jgi:beta-galactosidase